MGLVALREQLAAEAQRTRHRDGSAMLERLHRAHRLGLAHELGKAGVAGQRQLRGDRADFPSREQRQHAGFRNPSGCRDLAGTVNVGRKGG